MKPEEKAKDLVDKMHCNPNQPIEYPKECALVAVDEIINYTPLTSYPKGYIEKHGMPIGSKDWWKEVRTKIEKL